MRRSPPEPSLLSRLTSPADLRRIPREKLPLVAAELRGYLLEQVSIPSEQLAASLSTVGLAVALHYAYRTPQDRVVWDGDQPVQAHRVLTGRRPRLHAVRQKGRLMASPTRADKYEHFGMGQMSASISAAVGMASAAAIKGEKRGVVAVIGDRALAAGMAFEALNHAGSLPLDLLVILNDSGEFFVSGADALSAHFARAFSGPLYGQLREGGKQILRQMPTMRELARRSEKHLKGMVLPGTLFEEMGFNYTGPLDAQDLKGLVRTLQSLQKLRGPQFLHIVTRHLSGQRRTKAAAVVLRNRRSRLPPVAPTVTTQDVPCFTRILGDWLCDMAAADPRIICVSAGTTRSPGLTEFATRFRERYFDVAGTEQHAVTFAAGLAAEGRRPVVVMRSGRLQRAYDQLIHDVALQRLPVLFAIDGAGVAAGGSATDQGPYDLSFLRCIPGLTVAVPADENECRQLLYTASTLPGPAVVRFPCGPGPGAALDATLRAWPLGRAEVRREGHSGLALLVSGTLLDVTRRVAERLDATLVNMRFVKPLDESLVRALCVRHEALVTIEENAVCGGAGSAVGELLKAHGRQVALLHLGIPDRCIEHGDREGCLAAAGLDSSGLSSTIERWWAAQQHRQIRAAGA
jgi:1-deoxy-D-xylulose-5-phosphate synthase